MMTSGIEVVERRHAELCRSAEAAGQPATHCESGTCFGGVPDLCTCECDACMRATGLLVQAQEEIV